MTFATELVTHNPNAVLRLFVYLAYVKLFCGLSYVIRQVGILNNFA